MNPARWRLIEAIFSEAADLPPADRNAFLDRACGDDAELRREIDTLIQHDGQDQAIRNAVDAVAELVSDECSGAEAGDMDGVLIGPYRTAGLIGRGGMGAVYRAVRADDEFRKQVAIKLVKRGFDSEEVIARFRRERQILASLEHPNIARLLDGGTSQDGSPYFVMEYVEDGLPITDYCERLRLTVEERLCLFLRVCDAVRHAHKNLVVHRDLKPRNILVDRDGTPKLLDFGIAKLLYAESGDDAQTRTGIRLLTPDYASPEQVRGETVTTAADVYSLGAVLFELLAGRRAHQFKDYSDSEVARVVCIEESERPSVVVRRSNAANPRRGRQLERHLQGDLDAIVMKAMRKEPESRYQSVDQLAEDIERHLGGQPVRARKGTLRYRAGKLLWRHRLAAVAVLLVSLSLVAGAVSTAWQARKASEQAALARIQAQRAERRFAQVRGLARTVLFDMHSQIEELPGSTSARESLVRVALEYLDSLARESEGDAGLQWELAEAYGKVARVQGAPNAPNLGRSAAALESFRKSIAILERLRQAEPASARVVKSLYESWHMVGMLQAHIGATRDSLASFRRAVEIGECYSKLEPASGEARQAPGKSQAALADTSRRLGDKTAALAGFQKAFALDQRWLADQPNSFPAQRAVASRHSRLGLIYQELGDLDRALEHSRAGLVLIEKLAARTSAAGDLEKLAFAYQRMGDVFGHPRYKNLGRPRIARSYYLRKNEIFRRLVATDPSNQLPKLELAYSYAELASTWRDEAPAEAERLYRRAHVLALESARQDPVNRTTASFIAQVESALGSVVFRQGHHDEGLRLGRQAVDRLVRIASINGGPAGEKQHLGMAHATLAVMLAESGDRDGALFHYRAAAKAIEPVLEATPENAAARKALRAWQQALNGLRPPVS